MCYHPKVFTTPSRYYNDLPQIHKVPCGECEDCRQQQVSEWSVRAYYETLDNARRGGLTYFITLTYNDEHLPHLRSYPYKPIPTFSYEHICAFLKSLRHLFYRGNKSIAPLYITGIRYLVTSEYGHPAHLLPNGRVTKGNRPHYHLLLHLPSALPLPTVKMIVQTAWPYGFISFSRKGAVVSPTDKGCQYVCKYINKDQTASKLLDPKNPKLWQLYTGKPVPDRILKDGHVSLEYIAEQPDADHLMQIRREIMHLCPRHYQSIGYGGCYLNNLSPHDLILLNERGLVKAADGMYITLPRYLWRKKFCDKINGSYILNEQGIRLYEYQFEQLVKSYKDDWQAVANYYNISDDIQAKAFFAAHNPDDYALDCLLYLGLKKSLVRDIKAHAKIDSSYPLRHRLNSMRQYLSYVHKVTRCGLDEVVDRQLYEDVKDNYNPSYINTYIFYRYHYLLKTQIKNDQERQSQATRRSQFAHDSYASQSC